MTLEEIYARLDDPSRTLYFRADGEPGEPGRADLAAVIPALPPAAFGSPAFRAEYGLKLAYVGGAMVGGISSRAMVRALAEGGALGVFGASGLEPARVEEEVAALNRELAGRPFGACLIHAPHDPAWEERVTEIYLERRVRIIEASAFMQITPHLVRYRLSGAFRRPDGTVVLPNRILAKVSRVELARRFFAPPPEKLVRAALERGWLTPAEAELAPLAPLAGDLTAEADSGGHTDFRPALTLWPALAAAAREATAKHAYPTPLRVGAAGGLGTPWALLAALEAGADYFVTGSINQSCLESGLAPAGRELLAKAGPADVAPGPAADMFELGARVQVLKFGTLYAMRAQKLAELYRQHPALEDLPAAERENLETQIFKAPLAEIWAQTKRFFLDRDPAQAERAEKEPKHKMALVFRWYLGQASRWAIAGAEDRRADWQILCGPAQGAFNEWARGTIYEKAENRRVMDLALNLFHGAAVLARRHMARALGVVPFGPAPELKPRPVHELARFDPAPGRPD